MDKLNEGIAVAEIEVTESKEERTGEAATQVEPAIEELVETADSEGWATVATTPGSEEYLRQIAEHITGNERPISTSGWIGVNLLMLIPPVNLLFLFLWAGGGTSRTNLKNYARGILLTGVLLTLSFLVAVVVTDFLGFPQPMDWLRGIFEF